MCVRERERECVCERERVNERDEEKVRKLKGREKLIDIKIFKHIIK